MFQDRETILQIMLASALVNCLEFDVEDALHFGSLSERSRMYCYVNSLYTSSMYR